jgi:hypothetical protein
MLPRPSVLTRASILRAGYLSAALIGHQPSSMTESSLPAGQGFRGVRKTRRPPPGPGAGTCIGEERAQRMSLSWRRAHQGVLLSSGTAPGEASKRLLA